MGVAADELLLSAGFDGAFHFGDQRGGDHAQRNPQCGGVDARLHIDARKQHIDRLFEVERDFGALILGGLHVADLRGAERELLERGRAERGAGKNLGEPGRDRGPRNAVHLRDRQLERFAAAVGAFVGEQ